MVQGEGEFHDYRDQAEAGQEVGVWVQGVGVGLPGEKQTGSKFDE